MAGLSSFMPFTDTRPAIIQLSASRREHRPARAIRFAILSGFDAGLSAAISGIAVFDLPACLSEYFFTGVLEEEANFFLPGLPANLFAGLAEAWAPLLPAASPDAGVFGDCLARADFVFLLKSFIVTFQIQDRYFRNTH